MSPRDFLSIHHLNNPTLSPDGAYLMYQRSSTVWSKNEKVDRYRMIDLETGESRDASEMQLKQNKAMFARIKYQALAIVVVAIMLGISRAG